MEQNKVFNLEDHIESVKPLLKPPVGNKMIFGDKEQVKFMCVGGPNARPDYHLEEGAELFYQLKGFMDLWIEHEGKRRGVRINEGEMFILPPNVPHSPQRYADTIGLVWERERSPDSKDGLRWYVDENFESDDLSILWEEYFYCEDLGSQLKPAIERYHAHECSKSRVAPEGIPMLNPPVLVNRDAPVSAPFQLAPALAPMKTSGFVLNNGGPEFSVFLWKQCTSPTKITDVVPGEANYEGVKEIILFSPPANAGGPAIGSEGATSVVVAGSAQYTIGPGDMVYLTLPANVLDVSVSGQGQNAMLLGVFNTNYFTAPDRSSK